MWREFFVFFFLVAVVVVEWTAEQQWQSHGTFVISLESIKWPFEIFVSFLILILTIRFGVAFGRFFFPGVADADANASAAAAVGVVVFADIVFQPNSIC